MTDKVMTDKVMKPTVADQIWAKVKDIDLCMFSLKDQPLYKHVDVHVVEPTKLYLTLKSSAVIQAIDEHVVPKGFVLSHVGKYTVLEFKHDGV